MSAVVRLYREPVEGHTYGIGGDPGFGYSDSDDTVVNVMCADTGEQCLVLQGKLDGYELGEELQMIGTWYNLALIGVENNKDQTANNVLFRNGYKNIYFERPETGKAYRSISEKLGWNTNLRTRPLMVAQGRQMLTDGSVTIYDKEMLHQWEHFVLDKGKFQGLRGAHDDLVMAGLISFEMMKIAMEGVMGKQNMLRPLHNGVEVFDELDIGEVEDRPRSERLGSAVMSREMETVDTSTTMGSLL